MSCVRLFVENDCHVLFQCPSSMECWASAGLLHIIQPRLQRFESMEGVLLDVCAHESPEVISRVLMLIWGIWRNRNYCIWNHSPVTPNRIVSLSRSMLASSYTIIMLQQKFCRIAVRLLSDSLGILLNFSAWWMQAFFTMKV